MTCSTDPREPRSNRGVLSEHRNGAPFPTETETLFFPVLCRIALTVSWLNSLGPVELLGEVSLPSFSEDVSRADAEASVPSFSADMSAIDVPKTGAEGGDASASLPSVTGNFDESVPSLEVGGADMSIEEPKKSGGGFFGGLGGMLGFGGGASKGNTEVSRWSLVGWLVGCFLLLSTMWMRAASAKQRCARKVLFLFRSFGLDGRY